MVDRQINNHNSRSRGGKSPWWFRHKSRRARRIARSLGQDYRHKESKTTLFRVAALLTFLILAIGTSGGFGYDYFTKDLPSPEMLKSRKPFQSVRILDRNGTLLYEAFDPETGRRTSVNLNDISQDMIIATLAIEDASFFENPGFDIKGVVRAAMLNASAGRIVSGGSTITQQVARNALLSDKERNEQTLTRKAKEAVLAFQLSREFSKEEVLETYLNEVYYGNMSYGVEAAAYTYFGKHARDLNLAESTMLAGFVSAPSDYDPYVHPEAAKERQWHVIDLLEKHQFVSVEVGEQARAEEVQFVDPRVRLLAPHFVMYVREQLEKTYGAATYTSGLVVTTTLDLRLQDIAEKVVRDLVPTFRGIGATNAALVSLNSKTGEILAMVGSADYYNDSISGNVNVTTSLRSPGSSIKPIMYVAAFGRGYSPSSVVADSPVTFNMLGGAYSPRNYDGGFRGALPIRKALAGSLNIPAVKTLNAIGVEAMVEQAKLMGITSFKPSMYFELPVTVGGVELKILEEIGAYTVFPALGFKHDVTPFETIADGKGNIIFKMDPNSGVQVMPPAQAYLITSILTDNDSRAYVFGPNSPLVLPDRPVGAKTGTSESLRDFLTMGYSPQIATGVWVGNSDGRVMGGGDGVTTAAKIWHDYMVKAHEGLPVEQFVRPPSVVDAPGCPGSGRATDVFIEGMPRLCTVP